ncbi:MAG: DNA circularization N-terminal domain-containing protein [Betaproteobacteria bacterium]|nr:DNA circularization N-terminal domain-containing protein [Betaproteobacteria bacterium]
MSGIVGKALTSAAAASQLSTAASGAANLARIGSDLASGNFSALLTGLGPWADSLQQASYRGIPFAVRESRIRKGRRTATHEYPYRDDVWVEDLGRGVRHITLTGFLIGDNVYQQSKSLQDSVESGIGLCKLVHPSLGAIYVSLISFSCNERAEQGRVVGVEFEFIQGGKVLYPTTANSTQSNSVVAAATADAAAAADFLSDVSSAVSYGATVVSKAVAVAVAFARLGQNAISDAGLIANAVTGLPGIFAGRYGSGNQVTPQPAGTTVASAISAFTVARAAALADIAGVSSIASDDIPASAQQVVADIAACAENPSDQIRLLSPLASYQPLAPSSTAPIGSAISIVQTATVSVWRRAALTGIARGTAIYQPSSYDDAAAQINAITTLMDAEILSAADLGDTESYLAFRALRAAVCQDLIARGGNLPHLITVQRGAALPSLVLAYQLYQDATRSDDLIARVNTPAPLWMPTKFQALSS